MKWKMCAIGLIALAGCSRPPNENPNPIGRINTARASESVPKNSAGLREYVLSVPNMS
jgi:hypothetical protein